METLKFALLFGTLGFFVAVIYTFVIGFAGLPGAILSAGATNRSPDGITPIWGLLLTMAGQLYASLCLVALSIHVVEAHFRGTTVLGKWVVWSVAFFVSIAPVIMALKDAVHAERRNVQHSAMTLTAPLTVLGFFLFLFFPTIMNAGWGWIPQF